MLSCASVRTIRWARYGCGRHSGLPAFISLRKAVLWKKCVLWYRARFASLSSDLGHFRPINPELPLAYFRLPSKTDGSAFAEIGRAGHCATDVGGGATRRL